MKLQRNTTSGWSCIRWILIRDATSVTGSARNISNLRIFRSENAKHSCTKKFIQIECIQNRRGGRSDQRSVYALVTLNMKSFLCARFICTTAYIFIELQIAHAVGQLSGIFGKSDKNYRLRTARRIVQTPVGNLDKWALERFSTYRLAAERAEPARSRPSLSSVIKKFRDQTAERGAIDMHWYFTANWIFFVFFFLYSKRYLALLTVNSISDA